jgi:PKD repeat protein
VKLLRLFLLSILCAFAFTASAQLTIGTVDPGPYTPGSTIAATFDIDPSSCVPIGNIFNMYLSDASGSFATPTLIGSYTGFYSTFVNGTIPNTPAIIPGTGYKIRIQASSNPALFSESAAFEIKAGTSVEARIVSNRPITGNTEAFGFCSGARSGPAADILLTNGSTATGTVTATFTNELDQTSSVLSISPQVTFNPQKAHYTMFVKTVMPDGTVATKAYFIINNETITAFSTNGNNVVCLPGALTYLIDVIGTNGIRKNFPGNTYRIDWGDNTTNTYTFCDLQGGSVQHQYTNTSCGQTFTSGSTTIYNAFGINIQMVSAFASCGNIGTAVSTTAKVVRITQTLFSGPLVGCTNANQTFTNNSVLGDDPNNTGPSCLPDNATFNWYVDGMLIPAFAGVTRATPFVYQFTTNGIHTVTLEAISSTPCQSPVATQQICIQNAPVPSFTVPALICTNTLLTPTNTSVVDIVCNNNVTYTWSISPTTGVTPTAPVVTNSATPPTYNFTQTGIYTISLRITTPTCGLSNIVTRTVTVNASPQAVLSPDFEVCALGTYNFDTANSPTRSTIAGTTTTLADTYTWTVTAAGTGTATFMNSTTSTSRYPSIRFNNFDEYTVTVVHQNNCGTATDSQVITFTTAPVVSAGTYTAVCYDAANIPLTGSITGNTSDVTGLTWSSSGGGTFSPNANTLAATYTPTQAERNARTINLTLTVSTSLPGACSSITSNASITIKDPVTVSSASTKSICTGTAVGYTPTSATAGATFAWTATGSANASGFSVIGNGVINDVLTNTDATTDATVTYIITPTGNGCSGAPFTFTVTIAPRPIVTPAAATLTICSGQGAGITYTSNLVSTTYTWTSTPTGGITGGSNNNNPTSNTTINDILTNLGTTSGTVTYTITPVRNGCSGTPTVVTVTVEPQPTNPNAGPDQSICNQPTYTLQGNTPSVGTGRWSVVPANPAITFDNDASPTATASGLQAGNAYTFRWTITGAASCSPKTDDVSISVDLPSNGGTAVATTPTVCAGSNSGNISITGHTGNVIEWQSSTNNFTTFTTIASTATSIPYLNLTTTTQYRAVVRNGTCGPAFSTVATITVNQGAVTAAAGSDQTLCNVNSTILSGNDPLTNTGLWTLVSGPAGFTITDPTLYNTTVTGLTVGASYIFKWTISGLAPCGATSDDVNIVIYLPSNGGTTAGSTSVCAGSNSGNITLSGQVGSILRWESSTDGFVTSATIASTTSSVPYLNLNATTQYRAVVQNGTCGSAISTVATVTVNQSAVAANAGVDQALCNANSTTLSGNNPLTNTGLWTLVSGPPGFTITDPTLYNTTVTGLVGGATYVFRWTISGLPPCGATSDDVSIIIYLPSNGGIATATTPTVCAGNNGGNITVTGQTGNVIEWQSSTDGFATFATIAATSTSIPYLNLTTTTQYRAVVKNGVCGTVFSTVATVTVNQSAVAANAGPDQNLCDATSTTLAGNNPLTNTGLWTLISGPAGFTFTDPTLYNTTVTGLAGGASYIFRWTISGAAPCGATSDDVSVINLLPIQNNTITTPTLINCSGQVITLTGSQPIGGNSAYTYIWESSPTGAAPWTIITGQNGRDLNVSVTANMSYRRTVTSGVCSTISNNLNTVALPPIGTNSIAADQTICLSTTPNVIIGSQPTGGDGTNYTYVWEQSTDGIVWVGIAGAAGRNYAPTAITTTTFFRRLVSSAACTGAQQSISNQVKITVNPNARAEYTFTSDVGCVPFGIDGNNIKAVAYPDRNNTYTWFADAAQIGTGINFPGFTISTYNTSVVIRLVVTSSLGCLQDEFSHTFSTRQNIIASYTQSLTEGCGPLPVTFTNTTPVATGNTYEWLIDGISVSTARDLGTRVFDIDPTGRDKIYVILLRVVSSCGTDEIQSQLTVKANPIPAISAVVDNGCSPFNAEFINTSPGGANNTYMIDFGDGSAPVAYVWGDPIRHIYTTTVVRDFDIRMTASNQCSVVTSDPITIRVSPNSITPAFFAPPNQQTVCVGTEVSFRNNTSGASRFVYDFKDGTSPVIHPTGVPETITHTFLQAGTYDVTMTATNNCSTNGATQRIVVLEIPTATFTANTTTGCEGLIVSFTQTNTGAVSYLWNFGDGGTSTDINPTHIYAAPPGQYTVSLTVINNLGCPYTVTQPNYITIVGPPNVNFAISPAAVISIPDYTFKFTNESTNNPQTYRWSFGDGDISTQKDPTHLYADTGRYLVTLRAYNEYGCVDSIQKYVQIVGIPGYTFVPNAFIPGGTSAPLQKFMGIGSGMKSWKMSIFNKWGQVLWETTKLEDGKPVEGWDGTYKGVPQPQGIYFWKIEVELLNGSEWKGMSLGNAPPRRTGEIYLIR